MSSSVRSAFLLIGSAIALLSFWLPGLYGVVYNAPAGSAAANVTLTSLPAFSGVIVNAQSGVYSGFSGPANLSLSLDALIGMAVLGVVSLLFSDVDSASNALKKVNSIKQLSRIGSIGSGTLAAAIFLWSFRFNMVPDSIHDAFVHALGNSQTAIQDANYLHGQPGATTLTLLFGLLLGYAGAVPKIGCALLIALVVLFVVGLVLTKVTTGAW